MKNTPISLCRKSPLPHLIMAVWGIFLVIASFLLGCGKAEGPIVYMDREALRNVREIALLPITNATPHPEINPLLDHSANDEMLRLKTYSIAKPEEVRNVLEELHLPAEKVSNPMDAKAVGEKLGVDGVMGVMVFAYIPTRSEIALTWKETDVKAHTFEDTKEELKEKHGVLWDFLVDLLIPETTVKAKQEYEYGTIFSDPLIGIGTTLVETRSGRVIYQASKYLKKDAKIPDAYTRKYKDIIEKEKFQVIDYIARLSIRELVYPLKTVKR